MKYRWDAALERLPQNRKIKVAEIGVWTGTMSRKLLEGNPWLRLYQVDRWQVYSDDEKEKEGNTQFSRQKQETFDKAKQKNLNRMKLHEKRVKIYIMSSMEAVKLFRDGFFDMVFLDGSHSFTECQKDIKAWLPKIKKSSWIGGHDYPDRPGVKMAVLSIFDPIRIETDADKTWWAKI